MNVLSQLHPRFMERIPVWMFPGEADLYQPVKSTDSLTGQEQGTWTTATYEGVRCRVMAVGGKELRRLGMSQAQADVVILLAGEYPLLDADWRIQVAGTWYEITVVERDGNGTLCRVVGRKVDVFNA